MKRKFVKSEDLAAAEIPTIYEMVDRPTINLTSPIIIDPEMDDEFLSVNPKSSFVPVEDIVDETATCFCNCGEDREDEEAIEPDAELLEVDEDAPAQLMAVMPELVRFYEIQGDQQILVAASVTTETLSSIPRGGKMIVGNEAIIIRDEVGLYLAESDDEVSVKPARKNKKIKKEKKTKRRDNLKTQPQKKYQRQKRQCISVLKRKLEPERQPHKLYSKLQRVAAYFPFII